MNATKHLVTASGLAVAALLVVGTTRADETYDRAVFYSKMSLGWSNAPTPILMPGYVPTEKTVIRARYNFSGGGTGCFLYFACSGLHGAAPSMGWNPAKESVFTYNKTTVKYPTIRSGVVLDLEVKGGVATRTRVSDGEVLDTLTADTSGAAFSCPRKNGLLLFAYRDEGSTSESIYYGFRGDIYFFEISEVNEDGSETPVHYYVPCKVDDVIALADKVTKTVLFHQGDTVPFKVNEADLLAPETRAALESSPLIYSGNVSTFSSTFFLDGEERDDASFTWDFDDGTDPVVTTEKSIQHVYASAGTFSVTVTGSADGSSAERTLTNVVTTVDDPSPFVKKIGKFDKSVAFMVDGCEGPLTNFPVLVRLAEGSPTGFSYADFKDASTGAELRFLGVDGTALSHEVDTWDPTGTSLVWVNLPICSHGTAFYAVYGGTPRKAVDATDVWSPYVGVWHMGEADGACADSTGNGLAATPDGATENSVGVEGPLGIARQSATAEAAGFLKVGDTASIYNGQNVTMSGWVKMLACDFSQVIFACTGGWSFYAHGSTKNSFIASATANRNPSFSCGNLWSGNWTHIVLSYETRGSDATCRVTANGVKIASSFLYAVGTKNLTLAFGRWYDGGGKYAPAVFDELRLRKEAVSDAFAAAEYKTAADANFLLSLGALDVKKDGLTILIR